MALGAFLVLSDLRTNHSKHNPHNFSPSPLGFPLLSSFWNLPNWNEARWRICARFQCEQIKSIEPKLLKVKQDMETLQENKKRFHTIYKGMHKEHISNRRRQKENRRKSNERKKTRYENNVQRVYGACVRNPPGNDLAECILYLPSLVIPKEFVNVEDVAELLLRRDAPYIAQLLHQTPSAMRQRLEMMCTASCILKSMLCLKRMKASPTAARATRKSLKKNSRENRCFNSNYISST